MLQASNLGRGLSPVSGVVVAVSGMGKISPFEIVKRMSVPMLVGFYLCDYRHRNLCFRCRLD